MPRPLPCPLPRPIRSGLRSALRPVFRAALRAALRPARGPALRTPGTALLAALFFAGCGEPGPEVDPATTDTFPVDPAVAAFHAAWGAEPVLEGPWDLGIHGARVVDGSGAPAREGGILVKDGVIAYVGPLGPDSLLAERWVDAGGRVLSPGFIDAHAHGDPLQTPGFPNFLAQGITTVILGMDGSSPRAAALAGVMAEAEALGPWANAAWLAGHGTLRMESGMGYEPSTPEGRERLAGLVARAMDAGAFGVSLGLEYDAGLPADPDELARLGEEVALRDGIISSHMRSEDADRVEDSLEELLEQGRRSGARVHASHLKVVLGDDPGLADRILRRMDRARDEGVQVSADVYPYTASFTGIGILFPDWARPPADYDAVARTRRDELLEHLRARVEARNGPAATLFGTGPFAGRTLEEASASTGRPYEEILAGLGPGGARAAYFVMDDAVMARFLMDPHTVVSTDGSPVMGHPRGYGAFALVIRRFVVEEGQLSIEEAVRKMAGRTADLFRLSDPSRVERPRGYLRPGFAADLLLFHPDRVEDTADFEEPHQLARGMDGVWVNGVQVRGDGIAPGPDAVGGPGAVLRSVTPPPGSEP
jgi:N-acyl-D-amino-acid deacylase